MAAEFRTSFDELARQSELTNSAARCDALRTTKPMDYAAKPGRKDDVVSDIKGDLATATAALTPAPEDAGASRRTTSGDAAPTPPTAEPTPRSRSTVADDEAEIEEASRAPLMEHLIELRNQLIVCAAALAIGFFADLHLRHPA